MYTYRYGWTKSHVGETQQERREETWGSTLLSMCGKTMCRFPAFSCLYDIWTAKPPCALFSPIGIGICSTMVTLLCTSKSRIWQFCKVTTAPPFQSGFQLPSQFNYHGLCNVCLSLPNVQHWASQPPVMDSAAEIMNLMQLHNSCGVCTGYFVLPLDNTSWWIQELYKNFTKLTYVPSCFNWC